MKKPVEWESAVNGRNYQFSYQFKKRKHILTVNGVENEIKSGFASTMLGFDEKFDLGGTEARLVIEKNKPDVVVDGVYLQSGKKYVQRPAWAIVFAVICIFIPVISLGGALPALLGFSGAALCMAAAKTSLPLAVRVALCTVITATAWILLFVLILGVSMLG